MLFIKYLSSKEHRSIKVDDVRLSSKTNNQQNINSRETDDITEKIETIKAAIKKRHGNIPDEIDDRDLIRNSSKCQKIIDEYNKGYFNGTNGFTRSELDKKIKIALQDPLEFWSAMRNYYIHIEAKEDADKFQKIQTEYNIKYNEIAFSVFDTRTYLSKEEIIVRIQKQLKVTIITAEEIFATWIKYSLIDYGWDSDVDGDRISDFYKLNILFELGAYESNVKIIREDWLKKNNKQLVDNREDFILKS